MDNTNSMLQTERMKELVNALNAASMAYYQQDYELMTNAAYDALYDELKDLEEKTGVVLPDSPTGSVGYKVLSSLRKVRHQSKMLSLDKTKEIDKLKSFLGGKRGLLSWKLDGLTIVLRYEEGRLVQALTRGNGEIGEDVTHNAAYFKYVPAQISHTGPLVLRGEAVISYSNFEKINESLDEETKYKNPRNLCSGAVRQLSSKVSAGRGVEFYLFSVSGEEKEDSKAATLKWAEGLGFKLVEFDIAHEENIETLVEMRRHAVENFGLPTDGLVLTYDSISYSAALGETSKFPKDSIAFKWADEMRQTTIIDVVWNTSRTGLINPVAVFEKVELEGTTVNRASLHNLSIVEGLNIGIGDTVTVYKANMIIPQIFDNLTRRGGLEIPAICGVCGAKTEIKEQNAIKTLFCPNPNCGAQKVKSLTHFASRDAMNIEGLSEATIEKFTQQGYLDNYTDIYNLDSFADEIKAMKGFGEKSFNRLWVSIEKSRTVSLPRFLYALGIEHIGLESAKLLSSRFQSLGEILKAQRDGALTEKAQAIDGFGLIMAQSVTDYFDLEKNISLVEKAAQILDIEESRNPSGGGLSGLTFVVTGDVNIFKNRRQLTAFIEEQGGKTTSSVSSQTNYLINNDINSSSSKNKKARELNIPIISEKEFTQMFGVPE